MTHQQIDWHARNMIGIVAETPLWRVFRYQHLLALFTSKTNVLVKPALWEDPFENLLGKCLAYVEGADVTVHLSGLYDAYYGQCWTDMAHETDAAWRIYAPGSRRGARVRVRAGALFASTVDPDDHHASVRSFLAKVRYLDEEAMLDEITSNGADMAFDPRAMGQASALLIKRTAFAHESEVRLLYSTIDSAKAAERCHRFGCEPSQLIEDIVLDPRLSDSEAQALEVELRAAGANGPITQSTLYRPPRLPLLRIRR